MGGRTRTATAMALRDQCRRPLVPILLVVLPAYVISRAIAETLPTPLRIGLPDGIYVTTTLKQVHGAGMGGVIIAFVAALLGVFLMQSALQADRRLVVAGFRPSETVLARLAVVVGATGVVVIVALAATAMSFSPASWLPVVAALILLGLIYASIGALVGVVLGRLAATYFVLFVVMTDVGVVQSPMFRTLPGPGAWLLPGYGPARVMFDGAFSSSFHAWGALALSIAWLVALAFAVLVVLRRVVSIHP